MMNMRLKLLMNTVLEASFTCRIFSFFKLRGNSGLCSHARLGKSQPYM